MMLVLRAMICNSPTLTTICIHPQPKPEVKVVANVPSLSMEEVAPVTTSDAARLAPEEIQVWDNRQ